MIYFPNLIKTFHVFMVWSWQTFTWDRTTWVIPGYLTSKLFRCMKFIYCGYALLLNSRRRSFYLKFFLLRIIENQSFQIPNSYFVYGFNIIRFQLYELEIWKMYTEFKCFAVMSFNKNHHILMTHTSMFLSFCPSVWLSVPYLSEYVLTYIQF
jgi:hypothetical protein